MRFSPVPEMDKLSKKVLRPGLPLSYLQYYLKDLISSDKITFKKKLQNIETSIINQLVKGLKKDEAIVETQFNWQEGFQSKIHLNEEIFSRIITAIQGRLITEGELPVIARTIGISEKELLVILNEAVSRGFGDWLPAISRNQAGWICERCNSNNRIQEWPSLYGQAATCKECDILGAQTSLQTIFKFNPANLHLEQPLLLDHDEDQLDEKWSIQFTTAQANAAKKLIEYTEEQKAREVLLWAACGAGKTEVSFPLIARYLAQKKKVLFTAPRQDVAHDVHPRLLKNFPKVSIKLMSGAVVQEFKESALTVSTTHQTLKFYRYFDLIIFDEVDAYPYSGSAVLNHGLKTALSESGQIVYLTATPSDELIKKASSGQCPIIRLPIRHHGHHLPLPQWVKIPLKVDNPLKTEPTLSGNVTESLDTILREVMLKGPLLVFVPLVAMVTEWIKILQKMFPLKTVDGSWSYDPKRREKVNSFQEQKYDIFLTTSILERGITVPGVQVVVLYADHQIYDVRSLVQMAGRTGRTIDSPTGTVIFLASSETKSMKDARKWIQEQNTFAKQEEVQNA